MIISRIFVDKVISSVFKYKIKSSRLYMRCMSSRAMSPNDLLKDLKIRGLVKQSFPDKEKIECVGQPTAYAGFDATADSLHVGNLLVIVALLHWQRSGFDSLAVIGDITALVGDPTGHKTDRVALSEDVVTQNALAVEDNLKNIFQNHENFILQKHRCKTLGSFRVLKNSDWYLKSTPIEIIRNIFLKSAAHIRVSEMLSRTSVKLRICSGEGINLKEFCYQAFQANDWLHLLQNYNTKFQFGGSDQLGNITTGYQLISSYLDQEVYGILLPLIKSETGDKFGKSSGNAVYLSPTRTSPLELYQFFMKLPDSEISLYLHLFTFYSLEELKEVIESHMKNPDSRIGNKKLAEEVTMLVHGEQGLKLAEAATKILFYSDLETLSSLRREELRQIFPASTISENDFDSNLTIMDLTMKIKCFSTKNDAKRIIKEGGCYVNFNRITSPESKITTEQHVLPNGTSLIRIGKKTYYLILWKKS